MARRRLNTRFVGVFFTVLAAAVAAAVLAHKLFIHEDPQQYITAATAYAKDQQWDKASANFGKASKLLPKDAHLLVQYGQMEYNQSGQDVQHLRNAITAWRRAVEIDPDYKEAWGYLLDSYQIELARYESQQKNDRNREELTNVFSMVRETASQLQRLDPKDPRVAVIFPELDIRSWLLDIPIPQTAEESALPYEKRPTDEQKVNAAVASLSQVLKDHPDDIGAGVWIAQAKIHQAQRALADENNTDADSLFAQAAGVFDDAIKSHPANVVDLYLAQSDIMLSILRSDPREETQSRYNKGFRDALETAQAQADPKNLAQYTNVKLRWARLLSFSDPVSSEQAFRDVIAKNPSDPAPKIELARVLEKQPARRADALTTLDQIPSTTPPNLPPMKAAENEAKLAEAKFVRAQILTDLLITSNDNRQRDTLISQIQGVLTELEPKFGDNWQYLKLKGKYQLALGPSGYRDAIQTLGSASEHLKSQPPGRDTELLLLQADAFTRGQQTGNAIAVLEQAMLDPQQNNSVAPHMALANLYINDRTPDRAKPHLQWLAERLPNNPEVIKLQIRALDPVTDRDTVLGLYNQLPEDNIQTVEDKAQVAHRIGNDPDAARLLQGLLAKDPNNVDFVYNLGLLYVNMGQKDNAKALLENALKGKNGDPTLELLNEAVNGASVDTLAQSAEDRIRKNVADPFTRELRLSDLARAENKPEDQLAHLKQADSIRPNDPEVMKALFLAYLDQRQFDQAQALLEPLAKIDADQAHGELFRFRLYIGKGDVQTALAMGQKLTGDYPEFSGSWEALGDALQAAGQYDDACTKYLQALDKQANNIQAMRGLIACTYQLGRLDDARRYITDARRKFPEDPVYREMQIEYELRFGDPENVIPDVIDQVAKHPDTARNYEIAVSTLVRAAAVRNQKGDPDGATKHIQQAHDILKQAIDRWPDSINFVASFGSTCAILGKLPEGEAAIAAISARPIWKTQPGPSVALAQMYEDAGRPADAEAPLRKALELTKNAADLEMRLAELLTNQRKYDQALAVLSDHQDKANVVRMRADILLDLNRGADAENEVNAAIKNAPNDDTLANALISVYLREGKLDQAKASVTQALGVDPKNVMARYYRAAINLQGSDPDPDAAISDLTQIREHNPNNIDFRLALAQAYSLKNDLDDAIHELETAVAIDPQNKGARLRLVEYYSLTTPPRLLDCQRVLNDALAMPQYKNDVDFLRSAAVVYAQQGGQENADKAVATIRQAMAQTTDKNLLTRDYLQILLLTKNYPLLLQESDPLVADPKCPWWVFDLRGRTKAQTGDSDGAQKEFETALNLAGAQNTRAAASTVSHDISDNLGMPKALAMIQPRTKNDATWKMVAVPLYEQTGDHASAIALAESAMETMDSLSPAEQDEILGYAASLYITANPPMSDKAVATYQKIIARHPNDYMSMNNMACIMAEQSQPPQPAKALEYSQKAFDLASKTGKVVPMVYDTQGWMLILNGKVNDGIDILQKVADTADIPDIHYHLAKGYLQKQLPESAQRELQAAGDLYDQAVANKKPVDTSLKDKIAAASKEAEKMASGKPQASIAQ